MFPDVESLAKKDSDISTKRYADLRIVNHFVWMSWASLISLIFYKQWSGVIWHLSIVGAFAFLRGALALEAIKNLVNKNEETK